MCFFKSYFIINSLSFETVFQENSENDKYITKIFSKYCKVKAQLQNKATAKVERE